MHEASRGLSATAGLPVKCHQRSKSGGFTQRWFVSVFICLSHVCDSLSRGSGRSSRGAAATKGVTNVSSSVKKTSRPVARPEDYFSVVV